MKERNLELYCLHRELCGIAVADILSGRQAGWGTYRAALLIESIVEPGLARVMARNRRSLALADQPEAATLRLARDLRVVPGQNNRPRTAIAIAKAHPRGGTATQPPRDIRPMDLAA